MPCKGVRDGWEVTGVDREDLLSLFQKNYLPRAEVLSSLPLNIDIGEFWEELTRRRKQRSVNLPLCSPSGAPYWFVSTEKMVAASDRLCKEALKRFGTFDPFAVEITPEISAAMSQEAYFTSFLEGAEYSLEEAVEFLSGQLEPENVYEQNIINNYHSWEYMLNMLGAPGDPETAGNVLWALAASLTEGTQDGTIGYRFEDWADIPAMAGEPYTVPAAAMLPDLFVRLCGFICDTGVHPLVRAAVAQVWIIVSRPFTEGNERLGRIVSSYVLARNGYAFLLNFSLSAYIARESFRYVKAIRDSARPDADGDLTYFLEYYLDMLARALAEAKKPPASMPAVPPGEYEAGAWVSRHEPYSGEEIAAMQNDSLVTVDEDETALFWQQLAAMEASYSRHLNRTAVLLRQFLSQGRAEFTMLELREALGLTHDQAANVRSAFARRNIARLVRNVRCDTGGYRGIYRFTIYGDGPGTAEEAEEEEGATLWDEGQVDRREPESPMALHDESYEGLLPRIGTQVNIDGFAEKMSTVLTQGKRRFTSMEWAKTQGIPVEQARHDLRKLFTYGLADRKWCIGKYTYTLCFSSPAELSDLYSNGDGLSIARVARLGDQNFWTKFEAVEESNSMIVRRVAPALKAKAVQGNYEFTMEEIAAELGLSEKETRAVRAALLNWNLVSVVGYISSDNPSPIGVYRFKVYEDSGEDVDGAVTGHTGLGLIMELGQHASSAMDQNISAFLTEKIQSGKLVFTPEDWVAETGVRRTDACKYVKKAFRLGLLKRRLVGERFAYEIRTGVIQEREVRYII